ncbi:trypsin-like peptidase domain-containing protein [Butyricicoccus pullicaecorum]|uniref:trypsin-like peptidase domain-containing protein n=1 Tax=Butyricicoccus pullicaecorum TaxID=501571 RepID=UPI0035206773
MSLSIRQNPMHLSLFSAFCGIRSRVHAGQKDVYLLEWLGLPESPDVFARQLGAAITQARAHKTSFICVTTLQTRPAPGDTARLSAQADALLSGGRLSLPGLSDPLLEGVPERALGHALDAYRAAHPSASDSMVKNCTVRLLCALTCLLPALFPTGTLTDQPKCVYLGVPDQTACLLLRVLPGLGCDTALIQPQGGALPLLGADAVVLHGLAQDDLDVNALLRTTQRAKPAEKPQKQSPRPAASRTPAQSIPSQMQPQPAARPAVSIPPRPSRAVSSAPTTTPRQTQPSAPDSSPDYEALAALASSVVMIDVLDASGQPCSSGSGVLIASNGIILTNFHVASRGVSYAIHLENCDTVFYTSELLKYHADDDLALIRLSGCPAHPIPLYTGPDIKRGQPVVAIGSPLGLFNSVSDGIIAGFRRLGDTDMIQFTAPTSPGSSGGALLDRFGRLIGIVTAGFEGGQNLNLAVSYTAIAPFVRGFL